MIKIIRKAVKRATWLRNLESALADRETFQHKSREEIREFQLDRFNKLWEFAGHTVPYYRELKSERNLPPAFASWEEIQEKIPLLDKGRLQENPALFLSRQAGPGYWIKTGGSTGIPTPCFWDRRGHIQKRLDVYYYRHLWGIDLWDKTLILWGHDHVFNRSLKARLKKTKIYNKILNKINVPAYWLGDDELERCYHLIQKEKVEVLYAYTNAAYLLAKACETKPTLESLRLVIVGAEPVSPHQEKHMADIFCCPVCTEYGSIDIGLMAATLPASTRRMKVFERSVILETLPSPTGKYEIVATNLRNFSFPLIRYRLGDLTETPHRTVSTGLMEIGPIIGRQHDIIVCPSGKKIHGQSFQNILKLHPEILQFQVVQGQIDRIDLKIRCKTPLSRKTEKKMRTMLAKKLLGDSIDVNIKTVDKIDPTIGGKHRFVINQVNSAPQDRRI